MIFDANLERVAKDAALEESKTARFWFRRKYGLTVTDQRYLDMTEEGILTDYWAHYYYDKPEAEFEASTDDYDGELAAMDKLMNAVDDLEDISNGDPSAD